MPWLQRTGLVVLAAVVCSCLGCDTSDRDLLSDDTISGNWLSTSGGYRTTLDINETRGRITGAATSTDPDWGGQTYGVSGSISGSTITLTIEGDATGDMHVVGTISDDRINGTISQDNVPGQGPFVATKE